MRFLQQHLHHLYHPTSFNPSKQSNRLMSTFQANGSHSHIEPQKEPDIKLGLSYWNSVAQKDLSNNGVLGGYGHGSLPRVDALGSRMFLLSIRPELSSIKPPYRNNDNDVNDMHHARRIYRALDVGAGIGRVTADVLIHLFDRVDLVEPVAGFIDRAKRLAVEGFWRGLPSSSTPARPSVQMDQVLNSAPAKGVRFWKRPIQNFDPFKAIAHRPDDHLQASDVSLVGAQDGWNEGIGYDVIWAQWTLGHLTDKELVKFLQDSQRALRKPEKALTTTTKQLDNNGGLIIVKENIHVDPADPDGDTCLFDDEDASVTRSNGRFLRIFQEAGLKVVEQDVQKGFDPNLYKVNFYALQ
ncbi:hypothetical protein O181_004560 [Austropuccinia psidii MF-1]|uniref:Alpha N-terminal protein methyltransferase 1 n=1 Tax=Austropuccinia psidii MF-1 TaxID=1389203 RepID=A0A9Q3GEY8_9BASI|nr:hypothetical protein [Austropuccinia psidii MF-1]